MYKVAVAVGALFLARPQPVVRSCCHSNGEIDIILENKGIMPLYISDMSCKDQAHFTKHVEPCFVPKRHPILIGTYTGKNTELTLTYGLNKHCSFFNKTYNVAYI
jgi:hypothetical protein